MKSTISTILFLLLFSTCPVLFAQFENGWVCGLDNNELEKSSSLNKTNFINPLPTYDGINFKVAVLYFRDADDTFMALDTSYSDQL